jgi:Tfp pilus assembly protein PilF
VLVVLLVAVVCVPASGQRKEPTAKDQLAFGIDMAERGLWSEALFRFRQADRLGPQDPAVLNNLAVAYEALGVFEEALAHYRKALAIDPNNKDLKANYARFAEFYQAFSKGDDAAGEDETEEPDGGDAAPPVDVPDEDSL